MREETGMDRWVLLCYGGLVFKGMIGLAGNRELL